MSYFRYELPAVVECGNGNTILGMPILRSFVKRGYFDMFSAKFFCTGPAEYNLSWCRSYPEHGLKSVIFFNSIFGE